MKVNCPGVGVGEVVADYGSVYAVSVDGCVMHFRVDSCELVEEAPVEEAPVEEAQVTQE